MLTSIVLNFNILVDAASLTGLGAIKLARTRATPSGTVGTVVQTGATGANGRILVTPLSGIVSSVTLTFDNADGSTSTDGVVLGSLADGRWQLTVPSMSYNTVLNDPFFRRFYGDENNDGTVDGADFGAFGTTFGLTAGQPGYLAYFDYNADGTIDGTDFAQFGSRFGSTL
jgi:hypothetical protein